MDNWLLKDLHLDGTVVLEGATGPGGTTRNLVAYINRNQWDTTVISVDIRSDTFAQLKAELNPLCPGLSFRQGDMTKLDFLPPESVDFIICTYTLYALDSTSFGLSRAMEEFRRLLRPGGQLLIQEEMPPEAVSTRYHIWQRKTRLLRTAQLWLGLPIFRETEPELLVQNIKSYGFSEGNFIVGESVFAESDTLDFFARRLSGLEKGLPPSLQKWLQDQKNQLFEDFASSGGMAVPHYALKCIKM